MYGLPQSELLAHILLLLAKLVSNHGCHHVNHAHGLWKHDTDLSNTIFLSTIADNFVVSTNIFGHIQHVEHLQIMALEENHYEDTTDWTYSLPCFVTSTSIIQERERPCTSRNWLGVGLHNEERRSYTIPPDFLKTTVTSEHCDWLSFCNR
jgi:hypothetical protein